MDRHARDVGRRGEWGQDGSPPPPTTRQTRAFAKKNSSQTQNLQKKWERGGKLKMNKGYIKSLFKNSRKNNFKA